MFGLGKKKRGIKFNVVRDEDTVYIEFSEGVVDTSADEYMTSVISLPIALDMVDAVSLALLKAVANTGKYGSSTLKTKAGCVELYPAQDGGYSLDVLSPLGKTQLHISVPTLQQLVIELNKTDTGKDGHISGRDTEQLDAPAESKQLEGNTPSFLEELGVVKTGSAKAEDATEPFEVVDAFTNLAQVSDTNTQG